MPWMRWYAVSNAPFVSYVLSWYCMTHVLIAVEVSGIDLYAPHTCWRNIPHLQNGSSIHEKNKADTWSIRIAYIIASSDSKLWVSYSQKELFSERALREFNLFLIFYNQIQINCLRNLQGPFFLSRKTILKTALPMSSMVGLPTKKILFSGNSPYLVLK